MKKIALIVLIVIGLCFSMGTCAVVTVGTAFMSLKKSDVATRSRSIAQNDPTLRAKTGSPLTESFLISGSIESDLHSGHADLSYDLAGPLDTATVRVQGQRRGGTWYLTKHVAELHASGEVIELAINEP